LFLGKNFFVPEKKIFSLKKTFKIFFVSGTHRGRFQLIVILTPQGVPFHPALVIGLGKNLLFKSVLAHCVPQYRLNLKSPEEKSIPLESRWS
jgi:hypothetical protein